MVLITRRHPQQVLLLLLLCLLLQPRDVRAEDPGRAVAKNRRKTSEEQCTICRDGSEVVYKGNVLQIPGLPNTKCQDIDRLLPFIATNASSPLCEMTRRIGTYCGCPDTLFLDDDGKTQKQPCALCPDGSYVQLPNRELDPFVNTFFPTAPPPGAKPIKCALLEAYFRSFPSDEGLCFIGQQFFADFCGCFHKTLQENQQEQQEQPCLLCPNDLPNTELLSPDRSIPLSFVETTCRDLQRIGHDLLRRSSPQCAAVESFQHYCGCPSAPEEKNCPLCPDGHPVPFPDKPIHFFQEYFPSTGFVPTCAMLESMVAKEEPPPPLNDQDSRTSSPSVCRQVRSLTAGYCGCPPLENHCEFCPGNEMRSIPKDFQDHVTPQLEPMLGFAPSCNVTLSFQYFLQNDSDFCQRGQWRYDLCGCNGGKWNYLGSTSDRDRWWLSWAPRFSGILSCVASLIVLVDATYRLRRRRFFQHRVPNQLFFGMTCCHLLTALVWTFSSSPIPVHDNFDDPTNIYGARGNELTCQIQGFFLQLGLTGIFYDASLCAYYMITIVFSAKDEQMQTYRFWFHGIPILLGLSLASAAIPHYGQYFLACHIAPPPYSVSVAPSWIFVAGPVFAIVAFASIMVSMVCGKTWLLERRDRQTNPSWRYGAVALRTRGGGGDSAVWLHREVLYQSIWFLLALCICWPLWTIAILRGLDYSYGFWLTVAFVVPLQGFFNCLIHFRSRLNHAALKRSNHQQQRHIDPMVTGADANAVTCAADLPVSSSPSSSKVRSFLSRLSQRTSRTFAESSRSMFSSSHQQRHRDSITGSGTIDGVARMEPGTYLDETEDDDDYPTIGNKDGKVEDVLSSVLSRIDENFEELKMEESEEHSSL